MLSLRSALLLLVVIAAVVVPVVVDAADKFPKPIEKSSSKKAPTGSTGAPVKRKSSGRNPKQTADQVPIAPLAAKKTTTGNAQPPKNKVQPPTLELPEPLPFDKLTEVKLTDSVPPVSKEANKNHLFFVTFPTTKIEVTAKEILQMTVLRNMFGDVGALSPENVKKGEGISLRVSDVGGKHLFDVNRQLNKKAHEAYRDADKVGEHADKTKGTKRQRMTVGPVEKGSVIGKVFALPDLSAKPTDVMPTAPTKAETDRATLLYNTIKAELDRIDADHGKGAIMALLVAANFANNQVILEGTAKWVADSFINKTPQEIRQAYGITCDLTRAQAEEIAKQHGIDLKVVDPKGVYADEK